jgi:uncharacterized protein (TIGR03083 family)
VDLLPPELRARVLAAAEARRPAGRPVEVPPVITSLEGYRRTVESFDALLADLTQEEWRLPVLRDLDVQGLVGHLIGVERAFQAVLGMEPVSGATDHVVATQPDADAQRGRPPAETRADWRARCQRTLDHLSTVDPAALAEVVALHGMTLAVDRILIVRFFEMWTHDEDIRRATGRPLSAPDGSRLALMTELAVAALPTGLERAGRPRPGCTARIVLTGPGGGVFQPVLDRTAPTAPDVRIVADATSFCRLVANRLSVVGLDAVVTGDEALGADVLAGAMALALD